MQQLVEMRVRTKTPQVEMEKKVGKVLTEDDYNVRLTGSSRVMMPDGRPLVIYLPGILSGAAHDTAYPILHSLKDIGANNRRNASGGGSYTTNNRVRFANVSSSTIGNIDPLVTLPYCRTTAWTGSHAEEFSSLFPLFRDIQDIFEEYEPRRFAAQKARADLTNPDWMVGGTVFTTMTVNNTYPTGVHTDSGDLDEGYSCLAVWRRGAYSGGHLTFPEWRVSVDLKDGDLVLMDAHQWHGNTTLTTESGDAERISLVLYYRTKILHCDSAEEETQKEITAKMRPLGKSAVWAGGMGKPVEIPTTT